MRVVAVACLGALLAEHVLHRVADEAEHGERDQSHDQQDQDRLKDTAYDVGQHGQGVRRPPRTVRQRPGPGSGFLRTSPAAGQAGLRTFNR